MKTLCTALTVITCTAVLATTGRAQASQPASTAPQTLARCVQTSNRLIVYVMMDESGSLQFTDPLNARVAGLRAALTGLARLADTTINSRRPAVEILLTGFSTAVNPTPAVAVNRWQSVSESTLGSLMVQVGQYAAQNVGHNTDFGTALLAARQLLAQRAAALTRRGRPEPCKALIWFTDGQYSIEDRIGPGAAELPTSLPYAPGIPLNQPGGGARAVAAGIRFICRPGGLMDGLQSDGVVKFTVGLSVQMTQQASEFLDAATTGRGGAMSCGSTLSRGTGEYLNVDDYSQLFFAFANLLQGSNSPTTSRPVCPSRPCEPGSSAFQTLPGLSRFLLEATTGGNGIEIVLRAPDGLQTTLRPSGASSFRFGGATIAQTWVSPTAVEVAGSFERSSSSWIGTWSYAFVAASGAGSAAVPRSSVQLFAGLEPSLIGQSSAVRGASTPIRIQLTGSDGEPASAGPLVEAARLSATITDPVSGRSRQVSVTPPANGGFTATIDVPAAWEAGFVDLDVDLRFDTRGLIKVAPVLRRFRLVTRLPVMEGFPKVSPLELQLASISGTASTRGVLTVTANAQASGCVWLAQPSVNTPGGAGSVETRPVPGADAASSCLHVSPGQTRTITVRFTTTRSATGSVTAYLPFVLRSAITPGTRTTLVAASFEVYPAPNVAKRISIIIALTILGVALPILLLWALNYAGAWLAAPQRVLALAEPVTVPQNGDLQATEAGSLRGRYRDFSPLSTVGSARRVRRLTVGPFDIRAVAARRFSDLFGGPFALVTSRTNQVLLGAPNTQRKPARETEIGLALAGSWLFAPTVVTDTVDPDDGSRIGWHAEGELVLLIADGADINDGVRLLADAAATLESRDWGCDAAKNAPPGRDRTRIDWRVSKLRWQRRHSVERTDPPLTPRRWPGPSDNESHEY